MSLREHQGLGPWAERLSRSVQTGRLSHAYIIEGDRCIDKMRFALDLVKAVRCQEAPGYGCDRCAACRKVDHGHDPDLHVVQPDDRSVKDEAIADLQEKLKNKPVGDGGNIAIIDRADSMTRWAQNRLLKTLEEPHPGTLLLLLSENTEYLLPTVRSRCITVRLGSIQDTDSALVQTELAEELMEMIDQGAYFCDLKDKLTKGVRDREDAFRLVDGLERVLRACLVGERRSARMRTAQVMACIGYAEEARQDLQAGVNEKYAIRNLILKIGG